MKILPEFSEIKAGAISLTKGLGAGWTAALILIVLALGYFCFQGLTDGFKSWNANRQIENYKQEAEASKAEAEKFKTEVEAAKIEAAEYRGAAAVYKQQTETLQTEKTELLNEKPKIEQRVSNAAKTVNEIRNRPAKPLDNNVRERVDSLGTKLDKLYPDE